MYIIYMKNKNIYYCKDNKPIAFNTYEEAVNFANSFANYAINEAISRVFNGDINLINDVQFSLSQVTIEDYNGKMDIYPFDEIKNKK